MTDSDGRVLVAAISIADLYDSHGNAALMCASRQLWLFLACFSTDRAYAASGSTKPHA